MQIALQWENASRVAREGRLTESRTRDFMADVFSIANDESLPAASVADYLAQWLASKGREIASRSLPAYEKACRDLLDHLGTKAALPMDSIAARDIVAFRGVLSERVSGATVNKELGILRGAWSAALRDGIIRDNVFARVARVKAERSNRRGFTVEEINRVLEFCDTEWRGMVLTALYTGQRLSDVAALTWRSIDLEKREIRIVTRKTSRPMTIPIAAPLYCELLKAPSTDNPDAPAFPRAFALLEVNGSTNTLSRQFGEIMAKAGLAVRTPHRATKQGRNARRESAGLSFHSLRHTATSFLKNAGISDVVAREIIGHDSAAVSRIYTHIEPETLRRAVAAMPDFAKQEVAK